MKIAILLYGYSYATRYRTYDIRGEPHAIKVAKKYFEMSKQNFKEFFLDKGYDIYAHIWQDDYFRESYIDAIQPKEYIIHSQNECYQYCKKDFDTYGESWYWEAFLGPRIFMMNKLGNLISNQEYDLVMLRRFDMIIKKEDFSLNQLDPCKAYMINSLNYETLKQYDLDSFATERLNDYQVTCSYEKMLKFLEVSIDDYFRYKETNKKATNYDYHFLICQRLKELNLYETMEYFLIQPFDVVITKDEVGLTVERPKCPTTQ